MTITLACLDITGTTVADSGTVEAAFTDTLATLGVVPGTVAFAAALARFRELRGRPPVEIFQQVVPSGTDDAGTWVRTAELTFERAYGSVVDRRGLHPAPGAPATLQALRAAGLRIALTSALSRRAVSFTLDALDWWDQADLVVTAEDVSGRGRPLPDMILAAALRLGVDSVRDIAVLDDSPPGVQSGHASGASIVATPAPPTEALQAAAPTHWLTTLTDFSALVQAPAPRRTLDTPHAHHR